MPLPILVWFRQDLRLADNPALLSAVASGAPVAPVFVLDDSTPGAWRPGGAARWWLHHSLSALQRDLDRLGAPLILRRGPAQQVIPALAAEIGAQAVHWNRCYEPFAIARDRALKLALEGRGIAVRSSNAALLHEPWTVATNGRPYRVFTPYHRACLAKGVPDAPLAAPERVTSVAGIASDRLEAWELQPSKPDWAGGLRGCWTPGEAGARLRITDFLDHGLASYAERRDEPGEPGTARLSPHLHLGEIGPRQVWHAAEVAAASNPAAARGAEAFRRELIWREFAYHLLYHFPELPEQPFQAAFAQFPWRRDSGLLAAWQRGRTGYPLVDAGMRELWSTGWMHNRVRMVAASFLVKHLLQPWTAGEAWFWDTLVDADLANNAASWQWVAGCGADAAPYFRIFNPVLQGQKFDPKGAYVRRWVPELARLPDRFLHAPWTAPADTLAASGVVPGTTYPHPIVAHDVARRRALEAYHGMTTTETSAA
jgi:deoxyribodipyrimidine photo-lyase